MTKRLGQIYFGLFAALVLAGCAHTPPSDPQDPFEPVNRSIYKFNDTLDRYALRPVAKRYSQVTPPPVKRRVGSFFSNISYPTTVINSYLQAKFHNGTSDAARFIVNTTLGIGGLFDVATGLGLEKHSEDFGQTLGYWGLGQGVYLMLPLLGPTTGRDGIGLVADRLTDPTTYINNLAVNLSLQALNLINLRAGLLGFDQSVRNSFDPYLFVRGGYLESRLNAVYDGNPPDKYRDDNYDGFELD